MLLTVGIVNLLSHVSTLVMGGDPALYLNKMPLPTEVVRLLIGESSTSVSQQQQFNMLLRGSGGGEGGISSPQVSRGSSGVGREDQLPRGSKQGRSSAEQPSVPHVSKTPSKRIRSSFDEASVEASQGFKKARFSHESLDLSHELPEEQEGTSLRSRKSNISQDSSDGGSAFHGGHGKTRSSSKQTSKVEKKPSFDDLLTQAIQAVSPQASLPIKKNTSEVQLTSQQASVPAAAVNQTPEVTVTNDAEMVSDLASQQVPAADVNQTPEVTVTNDAEMVSDLALQQVPAADVNQTPEVISVIPEQSTLTETTQEKAKNLTPISTSSAPESLSNESAPQLFRSIKAPPLIESTTLQVAPVVISEPMEEETTNDESMTEALSAAAKEAMKRLTNLFNGMSSEDVEAASSADLAFKRSTSQQTQSEATESMETETTTASTTESTTQSDSSASEEPALQQQRNSMFDELKRFRFNKGSQEKSQKKQKKSKVEPHLASMDSNLQKKSGNMIDELNRRLNQRRVGSNQKDQRLESVKSDPSTSQNELNTLGLRKTSRFDELVHGKKPVSNPSGRDGESTLTSAPTLMPKDPVFMKRSALFKKSPLAKAREDLISDRIQKLELDQKKMEQNIEWQKAHNPKFHAFVPLRELKALKDKISELKAIAKKREVVASSHPTIPIAQNVIPEITASSTNQGTASSSSLSSSSISTTQNDLLAGIKDEDVASSSPSSSIFASQDDLSEGVKTGVKLRKTRGPVKSEVQKSDLEKLRDSGMAARRQAMYSDDESGDEAEDDGEDWESKTIPSFVTPVRQPVFKIKPPSPKASSVDTPPVSNPVKTPPKTISADSPARRAVLAKFGKASPQAASSPSLLEQIRERKNQNKVPSSSAAAASSRLEEDGGQKKEQHFLIKSLSSAFDSARVPDPEPEESTQNPSLKSSGGWGAEDDEWEGWE
ncbi:MAG: hypothetical protein K2Y08_01320 [Alphaproteobacteria bacterium]|nr:hypothetical protein [Alphaproteobacteria bacterium]